MGKYCHSNRHWRRSCRRCSISAGCRSTSICSAAINGFGHVSISTLPNGWRRLRPVTRRRSTASATMGRMTSCELAHRGAPLKVCAAGACLLAGREDLLPALADAIDHLLVGAVLLDHAQDWSDDLAAGRYNAFVAYASSLPQTPENRETNTRAVQQEICLGAAAQPYFQVARDHLRTARKSAEPANCADFDCYLAWLDGQAATCSERLASNAAALLNDAVRRLFGPTTSTDDEQPGLRKGGFSND